MSNYELKYKEYKTKYLLFKQNKIQKGGRTSDNPFLRYDDWNSLINPIFPSKFEDYKIIKNIAKGSYGTVYLVDYKDIKYAIKIQKYDSLEMKERFHEAKLLRILTEIPIITKYCSKTFSIFIDNSVIYHVMEYIDGITLKTYLEQNPNIDDNQKKQICSNLIKGMYILHSLNIVHRDIKPENIIYDNTENVFKFIDFGLSCQSLINYDLECFKKVKGTLNYKAPELFSETHTCIDLNDCIVKNKAIDIWALGVVFYNICYNNKFPYEVKTIVIDWMLNLNQYEIERKKLNEYLNKQNKSEFDEIIIPMLNENKNERIKIENLLKNKFLNINEQEILDSIASSNINKYIIDYNNIIKDVQTNTQRLLKALEDKNKSEVENILNDKKIYLDMNSKTDKGKSAIVLAVEWGMKILQDHY